MSPAEESIDALKIFIYRLIDGTCVVAEQRTPHNADNFLEIINPLEVIRDVDKSGCIRIALTDYLPLAEDPEAVIPMDSIISRVIASYELKFSYVRFILVRNLSDIMTEEQITSILLEEKGLTDSAITDVLDTLSDIQDSPPPPKQPKPKAPPLKDKPSSDINDFLKNQPKWYGRN